MYHPMEMDLVRIEQEELRARAQAHRRAHEATESRPRRQPRPRPGRALLRLAFTDTAMRPMPPACSVC